MKLMVLMMVLALCSACAFDNHSRAGLRDYDPCVRCGEGWTFLPNEALVVK